MGVLELMTLVFIYLKVAGEIDWSWWLVVSPFLVAVVFYVCMWSIFATVFYKVFKWKK